MANPEHVQWLLEGADSWNARRNRQDFEPDLAGVNIHEEFRKAGLLDSSGRIPLSGVNLDRADLRGATLCGYPTGRGGDFRNASFFGAELQNAILTNSRLEGARFIGARLQGANMHAAKLCDADMATAHFGKTDLSQADLTNVRFGIAYCKNANFSGATLVGADLLYANLVGADLGASRPWNARLYTDSKPPSGRGVRADCVTRIGSISDLLEACHTLRSQYPDAVLFFRGESTSGWDLRPSVMRCAGDGEYRLRARESDMLLELMARRPEDFQETQSALAEWVLAQHHGLSTRLLDITRNPLVALFWACVGGEHSQSGRLHVFSLPRPLVKPFNSDTVTVIANFAKLSRADQNKLLGWTGKDVEEREPDPQWYPTYRSSMSRLYQLIRKDKPYFEERIDPRDFFRVFVVEPQQSFDRIRVQSGAFLISAFHERFECREVLNVNSGIPIYGHCEWEVPYESKHAVQEDLRLLNITRETLCPSLTEAAAAVTQDHSP